jgi:hypothetical protein
LTDLLKTHLISITISAIISSATLLVFENGELKTGIHFFLAVSKST